jgi:hypothetical protein
MHAVFHEFYVTGCNWYYVSRGVRESLLVALKQAIALYGATITFNVRLYASYDVRVRPPTNVNATTYVQEYGRVKLY